VGLCQVDELHIIVGRASPCLLLLKDIKLKVVVKGYVKTFRRLFTFMGMPVTMVDLRLKWSLASEMHLSRSSLAGKQYTTEEATDESCSSGRVDRGREGRERKE